MSINSVTSGYYPKAALHFARKFLFLNALRKTDLPSIHQNTPGKKYAPPSKIYYIDLNSESPERIKLIESLTRWLQDSQKMLDEPHFDNDEQFRDLIYQNRFNLTFFLTQIQNYRKGNDSFILVAENETGEIEAFTAGYFSNSTFIEYLSTNPKNLSVPQNKVQRRGGASSLLHHVAKTSILFRKNLIFLQPKSGSESFYDKMGFVLNNEYMELNLRILMEKAQKISNSI
ncbi:MAG: hypothetical protein JSS32_04600 [Verrucomicrobia bacterium]|nr:hypothetical protein [Verrucomicrobiota bacterium]